MVAIKPTVYLIKNDVTQADAIFKDGLKLECSKGPTGEFLFFKNSSVHDPKWLPYIQSHFKVDPKKFWNASAYAVIVLKEDNRFFAITFGMGSHLIDAAKIEYNFGIRVAINSVPSGDLRQMDMTTPESYSQKTKKHMPKNSTPEEMGINKQKDILRGLAGTLPKNHILGKSLVGKDSIRLTKNVTSLKELRSLCKELLVTSKKTTYTKDYPWIDNMAIVNDPVWIDKLYADLLAALKANNFEHMFISTPILVEDFFKYEGFVFKGNKKKKKDVYPFPNIEDLVTDLGETFIQGLDKDAICKTCRVYLRDEDDIDQFGWPLSRCISWETEISGSKYILSDGDWYKIENKFYSTVAKFFSDRVKSNIHLPEASADYGKESDYNHRACKDIAHYHLFDLGHPSCKTKTITSDGNEICDIFDAQRKRFIHVKPGKASTDISHLIRQGAFSARILRSEIEERNQFRKYLTSYGCNPNLIPEPYNPGEYTVTYALILGQTQSKDIPFFSKVSFKDTVENSLEMMGYKCEFGYIDKLATTN